MKKIVTILLATFVSMAAFSQEKFSEIDMRDFSMKGAYMSYTIGEDVENITSTRYVAPFSINKYETTYGLWYDVRVWGEKNGYYFENLGQEGSMGIVGREPTSAGKNQPVTRVNWYDAIVWCNALSEKSGLKPCYTYGGKVLRDSGDTVSCDLAKCDWNANGYRLPTEAEWEFAARLTKNNFQPGDLASGEINGLNSNQVAWLFDNSDGRTHVVGTAGANTPLKDEPDFAGTGKANGADIFDMSGNVMEYCWDWFQENYLTVSKGARATGPAIGETRVARGAAWSEETLFTYVGDRYAYDPNESYAYLGFRIARKASF